MGFLQKTFSGRQFPFVVLTAAVIVWVLCLNLFQDGMFIDGIQYAAVSRNLARGIGTFWNPVLAQNSVAGLNSFHEHPPLVFFIQSFFFKVFGFNNIYPERIYCLFTFLLTATFMALIWRNLLKGQPTQHLWWLPVFLWIIMPIVFWAYVNDIQENTVGVFTTAAVYFLLRAAGADFAMRSISFYLGCTCILLAGFCKGVPGLFPAGFFFIYWFSTRKIKISIAIVYTLVTLVIAIAAIGLILQNMDAREALRTWLFDRMLKRIASDPTENSHFYILTGLLTEQLPALILVALALFTCKIKNIHIAVYQNYVLLFVLLGLSASLPLMLTLVQRNFYFIPALPMFAIAWALLAADAINYLARYLAGMPVFKTRVTLFAIAALTSGIITTGVFAGKIKRDKAMLQDVYTIQKQVPPNSFISVPSNIMWLDWSFRCYMMRYNEISFTDKDTCNYFITRQDQPLVNTKYTKIALPLNIYQLNKAK